MDVFLKVAAAVVGCTAVVATAMGIRDVVTGLQAGSTMTLGGLVEVGVVTAIFVVAITAGWYVFTSGRKGLQRIGDLIDTVPGQTATGVLMVVIAINQSAYLIRESRWLELIFAAVWAVLGVSALRSAVHRYRKRRDKAGLGPEIEKLA